MRRVREAARPPGPPCRRSGPQHAGHWPLWRRPWRGLRRRRLGRPLGLEGARPPPATVEGHRCGKSTGPVRAVEPRGRGRGGPQRPRRRWLLGAQGMEGSCGAKCVPAVLNGSGHVTRALARATWRATFCIPRRRLKTSSEIKRLTYGPRKRPPLQEPHSCCQRAPRSLAQAPCQL